MPLRLSMPVGVLSVTHVELPAVVPTATLEGTEKFGPTATQTAEVAHETSVRRLPPVGIETN